VKFNWDNNQSVNAQNLNFDLFKQQSFGFNKNPNSNANKLESTFLIDLNVYRKINKINVLNFTLYINKKLDFYIETSQLF
jgi:hypothetical protein